MYNRNYDPWTLASNIVEHRQVLYLGPVYSSTPEEFQHPASFLWLDLPSTLFRCKKELFAIETKRFWIHLIYILNVDRKQSETIFFLKWWCHLHWFPDLLVWRAISFTRRNSPMGVSGTRIYGLHGKTNKQTKQKRHARGPSIYTKWWFFLPEFPSSKMIGDCCYANFSGVM